MFLYGYILILKTLCLTAWESESHEDSNVTPRAQGGANLRTSPEVSLSSSAWYDGVSLRAEE